LHDVLRSDVFYPDIFEQCPATSMMLDDEMKYVPVWMQTLLWYQLLLNAFILCWICRAKFL